MVEVEREKRIARIGEGLITAIVGRTGYLLKEDDQKTDYGTDFRLVELRKVLGKLDDGLCRFRIQLKTTTKWEVDKDYIIYDLDVDAYNKMIQSNIDGIEKLVIVVMLLDGKIDEQWLSIDNSRIIFFNSMFWYQSDSTTFSKNDHRQRIKIPFHQVFNKSAITMLSKKLSIRKVD